MKVFKLVLAVLVSLGLTLVVAPHASAEEIPPEVGGGYVGVSFPDFRFPGTSCYMHSGAVVVEANDDEAYEDFWVDLDLTVTRNGEYVDGWFGTAEYSGTYELETQLCRGSNTTGTYTISGTVTFWDWDYNSYEVAVTDNFVVLAPHTSSLAVAKSTYGAHGWKITGAVKYDGRYWAGKRVYFQRRTSSGWSSVTSKTANSTGRVYFYYTPPAGAAKQYRLYISGSAGAPAKATGAFYLKRR